MSTGVWNRDLSQSYGPFAMAWSAHNLFILSADEAQRFRTASEDGTSDYNCVDVIRKAGATFNFRTIDDGKIIFLTMPQKFQAERRITREAVN